MSKMERMVKQKSNARNKAMSNKTNSVKLSTGGAVLAQLSWKVPLVTYPTAYIEFVYLALHLCNFNQFRLLFLP